MPRQPTAVFCALAIAALFSLSTVSAYTDPFICLVNAQRAAAGIGPVGFSAALQGVARKQASDMASMNAVTHTGADGSTPFDRLGNIGLSSAGENVAGGQSNPMDAMTSFMNSPGHRANILNPGYTCFGGARAGNKYAQEFGSGLNCPIPNCAGYFRRARRSPVEIADAFSVIFEQAAKSNATARTNDQ